MNHGSGDSNSHDHAGLSRPRIVFAVAVLLCGIGISALTAVFSIQRVSRQFEIGLRRDVIGWQILRDASLVIALSAAAIVIAAAICRSPRMRRGGAAVLALSVVTGLLGGWSEARLRGRIRNNLDQLKLAVEAYHTTQPEIVHTMTDADFQQFEGDLVRYGRPAFERIRAQRPNDRFYSFAFYTSGGIGYAAVTASSEEGLREVATEYQAMDRYSSMPIEDLVTELRWSPADSPLHALDGTLLDEFDPTMEQIGRVLDRLDVDDPRFDEFYSRIEDCFLTALRRLDAEGVFGTGAAREAVTLNLLMGDQSDEERFANAAKVNPPHIVARLVDETEAGHKVYDSRNPSR